MLARGGERKNFCLILYKTPTALSGRVYFVILPRLEAPTPPQARLVISVLTFLL